LSILVCPGVLDNAVLVRWKFQAIEL
jgi:hypothetical protein